MFLLILKMKIFCFRTKLAIMLRSLTGLRAINSVYNPMRLLTSATANTLKVKEEVKRERQLALLGGGQKRIDAQHKKGTKNE